MDIINGIVNMDQGFTDLIQKLIDTTEAFSEKLSAFGGSAAISSIQMALSHWNKSFDKIHTLITTTPQNWAPGVYNAVCNVADSLIGTAEGLLILIFLIGMFRTTSNFMTHKNPWEIVKHFIRLILSEQAIIWVSDKKDGILVDIYSIMQQILEKITNAAGNKGTVSVPEDLSDAITKKWVLSQWGIQLEAELFYIAVVIMCLVCLLTVYGRFFKLYMYIAVAPIPMAFFASEGTQRVGISFIKSFTITACEALIIALACYIFSFIGNSTFDVFDNATSANGYMFNMLLQMLVMTGIIKSSDHVVREMISG